MFRSLHCVSPHPSHREQRLTDNGFERCDYRADFQVRPATFRCAARTSPGYVRRRRPEGWFSASIGPVSKRRDIRATPP